MEHALPPPPLLLLLLISRGGALHAEAINIGCTYGDQAQQMAQGEAQSLPTRILYIKLAWHIMKNITCHWGT